MDHNYNIVLLNDINPFQSNVVEAAQKTIHEFMLTHKNIDFIDAKIQDDTVSYEWSYELSGNFLIKIGTDELKTEEKKINIEVKWSDSGCSCNSIGSEFHSKPCLPDNVIYNNDIWYLLTNEQIKNIEDKNIKIRNDEIIKKREEINKRTNILKEILLKRGLELRNDSILCNNYINGDNTYSLDYIATKMCEMKYLYEYCNYGELQKESKKKGLFDREKLKEQSLKKYSNGIYPSIYPWEKNYDEHLDESTVYSFCSVC